MKPVIQLLITGLLVLMLPSCMSMYVNENSYQAHSSAVNINGAEVKIALKPMGGQAYGSFSAMVVGVGAGKTDGPFIWRVEAEGQEGVHEKLWVNSIRVVTTDTKRNEPLPKHYLKFESKFKKMKEKENVGKTFANHQFPGKLEVYPNKDGRIMIIANVSVKSNKKTESKNLKFELDPNKSKGFESVFIPTEVVKSFGRKDPTEWKW